MWACAAHDALVQSRGSHTQDRTGRWMLITRFFFFVFFFWCPAPATAYRWAFASTEYVVFATLTLNWFCDSSIARNCPPNLDFHFYRLNPRRRCITWKFLFEMGSTKEFCSAGGGRAYCTYGLGRAAIMRCITVTSLVFSLNSMVSRH